MGGIVLDKNITHGTAGYSRRTNKTVISDILTTHVQLHRDDKVATEHGAVQAIKEKFYMTIRAREQHQQLTYST